jgi:hypothetical protein
LIQHVQEWYSEGRQNIAHISPECSHEHSYEFQHRIVDSTIGGKNYHRAKIRCAISLETSVPLIPMAIPISQVFLVLAHH